MEGNPLGDKKERPLTADELAEREEAFKQAEEKWKRENQTDDDPNSDGQFGWGKLGNWNMGPSEGNGEIKEDSEETDKSK